MRVLVTGGAGYIGSHTALALQEVGNDVLVLDNFVRGYRQLVDNFPYVDGDIGDRRIVLEALEGVDAVLHFAAFAYVGESVASPRMYFENNVQKAITLLNAAVDARVQFFVFSSTCAVYGNPSRLPITESCPKNPINPYGATKSFLESLLLEYGRAYGIKHVSLRYFNAAGADALGRVGELHQPETHLIPSVLEVAAGRRTHIDIYGDDYPTSDGTCVRDYIHVTDLAEAHVRALECLQAGALNVPAINLGTGAGSSIRDVIRSVERITGETVNTRICPRREGDPPELVADASLANDLLGWKPRFKLETMVSTAWDWMRQEEGRHSATRYALAGK